MTQSSDITAAAGSVSARAGDLSPDAASRAADRATAAPATGSRPARDWRDWVAPLASLKLTVTLLVLSIFLTFAGSLAQIDKGIWTVLGEYFRCAIAWIELRIFFPRTWNIPPWAGFWFPGGWLLGGLLLTNLLAAHAVRFRVKRDAARLIEGSVIIAVAAVAFGLLLAQVHQHVAALRSYNVEMFLILVVSAFVFVGCRLVFGKRAGIAMLHGGLIFLLISEVITGMLQVEGHMVIPEGAASNYIEHPRDFELAVVDDSDPDIDRVTVVPDDQLTAAAKSGGVISHPDLPFDITVSRYMTNSVVVAPGPNVRNPATAGAGLVRVALERAEFTGTGEDASSVDIASVYVTLRPKPRGDAPGSPNASAADEPATYLLSGHLAPQPVTLGGKTRQVSLRFKRTYLPFSIYLKDFQHKRFVGTSTARDFRSVVQLDDPTTGDDREVQIYMNHPLRHAGKTFFQSSFLGGDSGTILLVVDNPGRLVPYVACFLVAVGLVGHFITHLITFLTRHRRVPA